MTLTSTLHDYIAGKAFSNALKIPYTERFEDQSRTELLLKICQNKKVLHIGCADHVPLIKTKILNRQWLHGLLMEVAEECAGIDINKKSIDFLTNELNIPHVYYADITQELPAEIRSTKWDIVVMGEILEHVDNPVLFLEIVRTGLKALASTLIVTVPNSFNYEIANDIRKSTEDINSDHRYHFTPFTLTKIMFQAGFETVELQFTNRIALPLHLKIANRLVRLLGLRPKFNLSYFSTMIAITDF